jgi:hypothetical protein
MIQQKLALRMQAIHIYHVVAFQPLPFIEWLHHGLMMGIGACSRVAVTSALYAKRTYSCGPNAHHCGSCESESPPMPCPAFARSSRMTSP